MEPQPETFALVVLYELSIIVSLLYKTDVVLIYQN
mgnify:CR=1 FL=1